MDALRRTFRCETMGNDLGHLRRCVDMRLLGGGGAYGSVVVPGHEGELGGGSGGLDRGLGFCFRDWVLGRIHDLAKRILIRASTAELRVWYLRNSV